MARLRNSLTGVVVNVDDETAARLNSEWSSAEKKPATKKAAAPKSDKK